MSEYKYDYVLVGRFRNKAEIRPVLDALRKAGKSVYCFLDNDYDGHGIKIETHEQADAEASISSIERRTDWQTNPTFRKIFEADIQGVRQSESLILVFPAGLSAHMELGVAYGLGKKCYAIGQPEKAETLYLMLNSIFPNIETLLEELA